MGFNIRKEPFMLLETVEMLYRHINDISFSPLIRRLRFQFGHHAKEQMLRRLEALEQIKEEVCCKIDVDEPPFRYYFGRVDTGCGVEDICMARMMTYSFSTLRRPGFREHVEEILEIWQQLQEERAEIREFGIAGLEFGSTGTMSGDLFAQVRALKLPAEFQMELYWVLRDLRGHLLELADLIEPLALQLEAQYKTRPWLMEEMAAYWQKQLQEMDPITFISTSVGESAVYRAGADTRVAFGLMNCDIMIYDMSGASLICRDQNLLYIGSGIDISSSVRRRGADVETVCAVFKTLGDKKNLEILRRLSKERSYGRELAEAMDMDPGNMSRCLTVLYNYGFLQREQEALRYYYRTDWEALRNFLQAVETLLQS